jgi:hypothetical protein
MKKARFLLTHPSVNPGKIAALDALQAAYAAYLKVCISTMLVSHRFTVPLHEKQSFFPPCDLLSSQIVKNVRDHAIGIVSGWAASKYTTTLTLHLFDLQYHPTMQQIAHKAPFTIAALRNLSGSVTGGQPAPVGSPAVELSDLLNGWKLMLSVEDNRGCRSYSRNKNSN